MTLRYRTIAPKLFTEYPTIMKTPKEKNRQKSAKDEKWIPFFLQKKKIKKNKMTNAISIAAANESKCLTSAGYGRRTERLNASGAFFIKLMNVGFNSPTTTDECPCS